ncbi:hypothetical protein POM88_010681 [Heracleum sosnowskyi]|uniref:Uncharacterized protein n=1 Tax=Heracleum sosnowskyi TaxID=360622 RepID=A0AAD8ITL0_9APIA|nr:hypothetical protein POM88_010681 [Heracleum sosnowskyi]
MGCIFALGTKNSSSRCQIFFSMLSDPGREDVTAINASTLTCSQVVPKVSSNTDLPPTTQLAKAKGGGKDLSRTCLADPHSCKERSFQTGRKDRIYKTYPPLEKVWKHVSKGGSGMARQGGNLVAGSSNVGGGALSKSRRDQGKLLIMKIRNCAEHVCEHKPTYDANVMYIDEEYSNIVDICPSDVYYKMNTYLPLGLLQKFPNLWNDLDTCVLYVISNRRFVKAFGKVMNSFGKNQQMWLNSFHNYRLCGIEKYHKTPKYSVIQALYDFFSRIEVIITKEDQSQAPQRTEESKFKSICGILEQLYPPQVRNSEWTNMIAYLCKDKHKNDCCARLPLSEHWLFWHCSRRIDFISFLDFNWQAVFKADPPLEKVWKHVSKGVQIWLDKVVI